MKKILVLCIVTLSILFSSCKDKTITTDYTIGCISYYAYAPESNWTGFQDYMKSVVDYNLVVHFTNTTIAENDAQAIAYFDDQLSKIDYTQACSFIKDPDKLVYGIARFDEIGNAYTLKSVTFTESGIR